MLIKKYSTGLILLGWTAAAVLFALHRSFWGDELVRLAQSKLFLTQGIAQLFQEPSPFAPGETFLNFISRLIFSSFLPEEIWARLPSLFWGTLSFFIITKLRESSFYKTVFSVLLFFSVAVWSLAIEMRPYGALIFSGALAYYVLEVKKEELKKNRPFLIVAMLLSHLYGVCYLAYAFYVRRRWLELGLSIFFVLVVLAFSYKQGTWSNAFDLSVTDLFRQTLGLLGNPHKGTYSLILFFALGLFVRLRKNAKSFLWHIGLLFFSILAPIFVTVASGYYFVPRQCAAGIFPFLAISTLGLMYALDKIPIPVVKTLALVVILFFSSVLPWSMAILLNHPPFPDQPRHTVKDFIANRVNDPGKSILVADPCTAAAVSYYADKAWGHALSKKRVILGGVSLDRSCYKNSTCLYVVIDFDYCSASDSFFADNKKASPLLLECKKSFDLVLYGSEKFSESGCRSVRSW
jgi:hypothetical protein